MVRVKGLECLQERMESEELETVDVVYTIPSRNAAEFLGWYVVLRSFLFLLQSL